MRKVTYLRAPRAVWRLADDRVVVRTVGDRTLHAEAEMTGSAVVVWLSLDEPQTAEGLRAALATAGCADPDAELELALGLLGEHRLIVEQEP
jgi:hypothetical protein